MWGRRAGPLKAVADEAQVAAKKAGKKPLQIRFDTVDVSVQPEVAAAAEAVLAEYGEQRREMRTHARTHARSARSWLDHIQRLRDSIRFGYGSRTLHCTALHCTALHCTAVHCSGTVQKHSRLLAAHLHTPNARTHAHAHTYTYKDGWICSSTMQECITVQIHVSSGRLQISSS